MSFIYLFLLGILIGSASIVPGVSGAVIAVIFGLYDKAVDSLMNLFRDFKNNFIFLFITGAGIMLGAIWFGNVLLLLYRNNEELTKLAFIGLILGGMPYLFKEVRKGGERINFVLVVISFFISMILFFTSKITFDGRVNYSFVNLFFGGFLYSFGKIIPGVSGSFLMIIIGMYDFVLSIIARPVTYGLANIGKVIPFLLGLAVGVFILIKIMNVLFKNHFGKLYSVIIGLVLGSTTLLIPVNITFEILPYGIVIMIICFLLSFFLLKST